MQMKSLIRNRGPCRKARTDGMCRYMFALLVREKLHGVRKNYMGFRKSPSKVQAYELELFALEF